MKKKTLPLAAVSSLLALGLALCWRLGTKSDSAESSEPKKISVLLRGSVQEAEALQRILTHYASQHRPLEYEIFHQPTASHPMPEVPFSIVWADAETLASLTPKLKRFDASAYQRDLSLAPILMRDGKTIGLPLYEHRYMTLYYDRSKISGRFASWLELGLGLMPLTKRLQQQYGLAFGEDTEHALPFFPQLWQDNDLKDPEVHHSAYAQLALLRHALPIVPLDCPGLCADALFKAGQAAMALAADSQLDEFAQSLGADRLGIMPLPTGKAPRQTQYLGIAADLKAGDRQAAEDFAHYLSSPGGQKEIFRQFRSIPSLTAQGKGRLGDRLADELLDYVRRSSVSVIESVRETALARLEPSLKAYFKGRIGETEAALALTKNGNETHAHQ